MLLTKNKSAYFEVFDLYFTVGKTGHFSCFRNMKPSQHICKGSRNIFCDIVFKNHLFHIFEILKRIKVFINRYQCFYAATSFCYQSVSEKIIYHQKKTPTMMGIGYNKYNRNLEIFQNAILIQKYRFVLVHIYII